MNTTTNETLITTKAPFILPMEVRYILIADFVLLSLALLLHLLGIVILLNRRLSKISAQRILLVHLSIVSIINLFTNATAVYWKFKNQRFTKQFIDVYYIAHMAYILNLCLLSLDRAISVAIPFRYHTGITNKLVAMQLALLWFLSVGFGMLIKFNVITNSWFYRYAAYTYNGFVVVFTALLYVFIICKSRSTREVRSTRKSRKLFLVPAFIVASFFTFAIVPHFVAYNIEISDKYKKRLLLLALIGINVLNNISDPLIYILFQPHAKKKFKSYLSRAKSTVIGFTTSSSTTVKRV